MPDTRPTGVKLTLRGPDHTAVESAADEIKRRFGARFAVSGRKVCGASTGGYLVISGVVLVNVGTAIDVSADDLLDLIAAG
jgi:hypothetical protein